MQRTSLPMAMPARGCNCDVCPLYIHNPAATDPVCSGRNGSCAYCACSVANSHLPAGDVDGTSCATCPVRCGSRPDVSRWWNSVGGTVQFDDVHLDPFDWPLSSRYVPILAATDPDLFADQLRWPALAVSIRRVVTRRPGNSGRLRLQPRWAEQGAHRVLGLEPGKHAAVLLGYGQDAIIERLWLRRHVDELVDEIAAAGWDLVCTPDWSVYGDIPRAEQLFNMRRSLLFAQELSDAGVNAAPAIYSFRLEDLDRWCAWIVDTNPTAVFVPLHTTRGDETWRERATPGLTYLAMQLDAANVTTRVVVSGVHNAGRVTQLADWFGARLHIAGALAVQLALKGIRITPQGRVASRNADRGDLLAANVRHYDRQIRNASRAGHDLGRVPADHQL